MRQAKQQDMTILKTFVQERRQTAAAITDHYPLKVEAMKIWMTLATWYKHANSR